MFDNRRRLSMCATSPSGFTIVILIVSGLCLYLPQVSGTCAARHSDGSCVCRPRSGKLMMSDQEGSMGLVNVEVNQETALVCLSNMTESMAQVICRQFGYQRKLGFGMVRGTVIDMDVPKYKTYGNCKGYEECLDECDGHSWQLASALNRDGSAGPCYQANERALICSNTPDPYAPVRPTPKVFEKDPPLTPAIGIEPAPADRPMVTPTPADSDHDWPLFPIIDYDMLPPVDAPLPSTTLAPVTDPARPEATGQPSPSSSPSELTPHESVLLPSSASPPFYAPASSKGLLRLLTSAIKAISTSPIPSTFPTTPFVTKTGYGTTSKAVHKELVVIEESFFDLHPAFDDSDLSQLKRKSYYRAQKSRFVAKLGIWPTTTSTLNMGNMKVIPALQPGKDKLELKESMPIASTSSHTSLDSTLATSISHASSTSATSVSSSVSSPREFISFPQSTVAPTRFISNRSSSSGTDPQDGQTGISGDLNHEGEPWFGVHNDSGDGSQGITSLDRHLNASLEESSGSGDEGSAESKAFGTATVVDIEVSRRQLTSVSSTTPIDRFRLSGRLVSILGRPTSEPDSHSSIGSSNSPPKQSTRSVPWTISITQSKSIDSPSTHMPHSDAKREVSPPISTPTTIPSEHLEFVKPKDNPSHAVSESELQSFISTITPSLSGQPTNYSTNVFTSSHTQRMSAITTKVTQTQAPTSNSSLTGVVESEQMSKNKSYVSFPGNTTLSHTINPSTYIQTSTNQPTTKLPNYEFDSTSLGTTTSGLPDIQQGSTSNPSESPEYTEFGITQSLGPHSNIVTEHNISVLGESTEVVSSTDHSVDTTSSPLHTDPAIDKTSIPLRDGSLSPSFIMTSPLSSINSRVSIVPETTTRASAEMLSSSASVGTMDIATTVDAIASKSASEATEGDFSKAFDTVSPTVIPQGSQTDPPLLTTKPTSSQLTEASSSESVTSPTLSSKTLGDPTKGSGALSTSTKEEIRSSISGQEAQKTTSESLVDNLKNPSVGNEDGTSPGPADMSHTLWSTTPGTLAETEAGSHRLDECEKALSRDELTSPGFPGPYPNDMSCSWNITVNQHEKVVFSIYEFRTAEPDALSIYVGSREGKLIQRLTGAVTAPTRRKKRAIRTIDTGVSSVFVTFTSDGDTTESGFRMGYKAKQKRSRGVIHGAATGPEKRKDGNENRNIIVIVVVIIIVIVLVILLLCCKFKCCKKGGVKVVIYDGFGSKSRIVPYETSEEKPRSGSWVGTPSERDPSFHMNETDEKPPPPVELQSSSTSGRRGQHTPEGNAEDESQEVWRSAESGRQEPRVAGTSRPTLPPEDIHAGNLTSPPPDVTDDEWEVRDSILFLGEHRPKQPGPKTEGPLDTTIHKKTPPGQEESRIGGGRDLSHLYNLGQRKTSPRDDPSHHPELLVSVPYAASMYTSRGQAIQMRAARSDPGDPVTGSRVSRGAPDVGHTSSILAKQGAKLPPLRTSTPTESSTATDEQKMAAAGKVRASGSRPSSSSSAGSIVSSTNSQWSNTTYTSARRPSGSGSPPLTSAPPAEFVCPLTGEVMKHPVVFEDGQTYERSAIQAWCETHDVSPTTNAPIEHGQIRPSNELRQRIREWKKARMQVLISAARGSPREPEQIGKVDT